MVPDGLAPGTECPECARLRRELDAALARIAVLEAQVGELLAQLRRNSSNSSTPPSADPPGAPKPVVKTPTGRKPGGQPGHPGHHRHRLPPEQVKIVVPYLPTVCVHCQAQLPAEPGPGDPEPTWHQVAELPELAAVITEHQGHARTCLCCGGLNRGAVPPDIRAPGIGSPHSRSGRPSPPNTKDTRAPASAVAASIVARSLRTSALMSSGRAWP